MTVPALTVEQQKVYDQLLVDLQAVGQTYGDVSAIMRFVNNLSDARLGAFANAVETLNTITYAYTGYVEEMMKVLFKVSSFAENRTVAQDKKWFSDMVMKFSGLSIAQRLAFWAAEWAAADAQLPGYQSEFKDFRTMTTAADGTRVWMQNPDSGLNNPYTKTEITKDEAGNYWWEFYISDGDQWMYTKREPFYIQGHVMEHQERYVDVDPGNLLYVNSSIQLAWSEYKDLITLLITNGQQPGDTSGTRTNAFANLSSDVSANIRQSYTSRIATANLATAFMLLTMMFDKVNANQQAGLSISTELLNKVTNQIATPLINLIQKIGSEDQQLSAEETARFSKMIWLTQQLARVSPQLSSIAESLNKAIEGIRETKITIPIYGKISITYPGTIRPKSTYTVTIGQMLDLMQTKRGAEAPTSFVHSGISGADGQEATDEQIRPGTDSMTIEQFKWGLDSLKTNQTLINAAQQIGALFTGVSKQVSTNFSIVANELNQILQLGSSVTSHSSGYQSMISSMIRAQRA